MNIKILGPCCANCLRLELLVIQTLDEMALPEATVEKVTVSREIERYLTGDPPGLILEGQLVWSGGQVLPTKEQIAEWIREVYGLRVA